jgi:short-subunit dehydrogenase
MRVLKLDVTDPGDIARVIEAAGPIDVLVNNAGVGAIGAFEALPLQLARKIFETNTFGVMAMVQAIIPQFRQRGAGVIVNVTSSVTLADMPLAAVYTASKQAIEGFSGSLALELQAVGITVKLVEPGYCPTTRFSANIVLPMSEAIPEAYAAFATPILDAFGVPQVTTREIDVAEGVFAAATDTTGTLRFPAGPDSVALAAAA